MNATIERECQLDAAILEYLKAEDAGTPLHRSAFLARYPEFPELAEFVADQLELGAALAPWSMEFVPDVAGDFHPDASSSPPIESFGDYEILGEIARGGMGAVYRARHLPIKREVAVKTLLDGWESKPASVVRFFEEAQISGQLEHPGIAAVHEIGRMPNGRPFFAMKLIKGQTLSNLLAERPSADADLPRFLKIFEQIFQTVAYAHRQNVLHRDLKPSNVMVGSFGEVQVMDWGLGKVLQDGTSNAEAAPDRGVVETIRTGDPEMVTVAGAEMGTYAYMPPEQANGQNERIGPASDVFSLGGMFKDHWEMEKFGDGLKSMTPRKELATFINARVEYWLKSKHLRNAVNCMAWCAELEGNPMFLGKLEFYAGEWERILLSRQPSQLEVPVFDLHIRRFNFIPMPLEAKMLALGVRDDAVREFHQFGKRDYPGWRGPSTNETRHSFLHFHGQLPWKFADEHPSW